MGLDPATTTSTHGFADLGVPAPFVDVLAKQGITSAFPIQVATVPDSLAGRDVLGRGRTGSGKTIAFVLPLLTRIAATKHRPAPKRPLGLVLVPTRELATQVQTAMAPLASAVGLSTTTIFGGVSQRPQVQALARGIDVVIACPGRLEDLMRQGAIRLDDVSITVIDEADHMADLGFLPAVKRILDATDRSGQRLLFSATLDNGVDVLVRRYLTDPVRHSVDDDASTEPDIEHHVLTVSGSDKSQVITELASGMGRSVLFTRTKHSARKLARDLTQSGVPAVDLHGNLSQAARDRNLAKFRSGEVRVLVATDVAARGIHVDDVALVVHVDPPAEHKAYTHRSGRTARAGASGVVVTLQTSAQRSEVAAMTRRAGIKPTVMNVAPGSSAVVSLTGPRAAHVTPGPVAPEPRGNGGRGQRGSDNDGRRRGGSSSRKPSNSSSSSSRPARSGGSRGQGAKPAGRSMSAADFSSSRRGR
jgi:superfamily II DNA/RNA helicase